MFFSLFVLATILLLLSFQCQIHCFCDDTSTMAEQGNNVKTVDGVQPVKSKTLVNNTSMSTAFVSRQFFFSINEPKQKVKHLSLLECNQELNRTQVDELSFVPGNDTQSYLRKVVNTSYSLCVMLTAYSHQ